MDIVIGTHRILSKDVAFKDLGLLIIDEEQRFGVANKGKIKAAQVKRGCSDVTATPMPGPCICPWQASGICPS